MISPMRLARSTGDLRQPRTAMVTLHPRLPPEDPGKERSLVNRDRSISAVQFASWFWLHSPAENLGPSVQHIEVYRDETQLSLRTPSSRCGSALNGPENHLIS